MGERAPVPELTYEERIAALDKGLSERRERAALKELMRRGDIDPCKALDMEQAQGMRVTAFLDSCPGIGVAKREQTLREVGISSSRRVRGLGCRQREALKEWLGKRCTNGHCS